MGILDSILKESGGAIVGQLAQNFGIDKKAAEAAIRNLAPTVARGLQRNTASNAGMDDLLDALGRGSHDKQLESPDSFDIDQMAKEGDDVLGHIFNNNKDVSRNVAGHAAKNTGLSSGMMKKMLPVVAMIVMGMISRKGRSAGLQPQQRKQTGGLLTSFLDTDGDGSIIDDVLSMAVKFL